MINTFTKWLIKTYKDCNNPLGDLAEDVERDVTFPTENDARLPGQTYLECMHSHLECLDACEQVHESLDLAWKIYHKEHGETKTRESRALLLKNSLLHIRQRALHDTAEYAFSRSEQLQLLKSIQAWAAQEEQAMKYFTTFTTWR